MRKLIDKIAEHNSLFVYTGVIIGNINLVMTALILWALEGHINTLHPDFYKFQIFIMSHLTLVEPFTKFMGILLSVAGLYKTEIRIKAYMGFVLNAISIFITIMVFTGLIKF